MFRSEQKRHQMDQPQDTIEVFKKCRTCSQTFAHILNREFGTNKAIEERALDPMAGGIMNQGHQCGMVWGAALATGTESYKRHKNVNLATAIAVTATQHIVESFANRSETIECKEIIGIDISKVIGLVRFIIRTSFQGTTNNPCFQLADHWAPEAIQSSKDGLSDDSVQLTEQPVSCASMVVKKMGASEEEMVMVAGFAGGLGLSGSACGALGAAIWMKTLEWCKAHPDKTPPYFNNNEAKRILKTFKKVNRSTMLCSEISGKKFKSINEHSAYINNGGCSQLIQRLAEM